MNVSGEESKSGFEPSEVKGIIERARSLEHVKIEGLMSMAPRAEDELINTTFSGLASLEKELNGAFPQERDTARLSALSMGMTEDWPVALRYGSTIVRIGVPFSAIRSKTHKACLFICLIDQKGRPSWIFRVPLCRQANCSAI